MAKNSQMADRRSHGCCYRFCVVPWVPLLCIALMVAGVPLWYIYSSRAADTTQQTLQSTDVSSNAVKQAVSIFIIVRTVVLAVLIACLAVVVLATILHTINRARHRAPGAHYGGCVQCCGLPIINAGTSTFLWIVMLGLVVLIALCATWMLGAQLLIVLSNEATRFSNTAQDAAQNFENSAAGLIDKLRTAQLGQLDGAPAVIKQQSWFQDFRTEVDDMKQTVNDLANGANGANNGTCQPGCVQLSFISSLAGVDNCLCLTNTLGGLQAGLQQVKQDLIPTLVGLGLLYLGASWLYVFFVAEYVHARRDHQARKIAEAAAAGSYHTSHPYGYHSGSNGGDVNAAVAVQGHSRQHNGVKAALGPAGTTPYWEMDQGGRDQLPR